MKANSPIKLIFKNKEKSCIKTFDWMIDGQDNISNCATVPNIGRFQVIHQYQQSASNKSFEKI